MLEQEPNKTEILALAGVSLEKVWTDLCDAIDAQYDMEHLWSRGGKNWDYEYKYRRGGKTLCALYVRKDCIGFMVILGQAERDKFEVQRAEFSDEIQKFYDEAEIYRDGKWIMFLPKDTELLDDFIRLLKIKRKPNRRISEK